MSEVSWQKFPPLFVIVAFVEYTSIDVLLCSRLDVLLLQVCPVCAARVGLDLVGHLTTQHGSFFKISFLFSSECS